MDLHWAIWGLLLISIVNIARYISSLKVLLFIMRESDPYLYLQVDGRGFFRATGVLSKQIRLFHYLREQRYLSHHDPLFIDKCAKVRQLFMLTSSLLLLMLATLLLTLFLPDAAIVVE
ncbi:MAG: universal stress protein UspB [Plesiomonas sp.]|uniref:universal stress protein UspB n=1 Tax=Plesiomonas sp. TaxID=2486279 RepID=UPI003F2BEE8E